MSIWTGQRAHLGDHVVIGLGDRVVLVGTAVVLDGAAPGVAGHSQTVGDALQQLERGNGVAATQDLRHRALEDADSDGHATLAGAGVLLVRTELGPDVAVLDRLAALPDSFRQRRSVAVVPAGDRASAVDDSEARWPGAPGTASVLRSPSNNHPRVHRVHCATLVATDVLALAEAAGRCTDGLPARGAHRPGVNIMTGNAHPDVTILRRDSWRHVLRGHVARSMQPVRRAVTCTSRRWPS